VALWKFGLRNSENLKEKQKKEKKEGTLLKGNVAEAYISRD
jgi:hypothetical protein